MLRKLVAGIFAMLILLICSTYPKAFTEDVADKNPSPRRAIAKEKSAFAVPPSPASSSVTKARKLTKRPNKPRSPLMALALAQADELPLKVLVDDQPPAQLKVLHERLSSILTNKNIPPPDDRINFFRSNNDIDDFFAITGWNAFLTSAEQLPEGILVTLRVTAIRRGSTDSLCCIEQYLISGNDVQFVGIAATADQPRAIFGF